MSKNITIIIRVMLIISIILFLIACIWRYEINRKPTVITVQQAFRDIEDYPGWTEEEQQRIIRRRNYLIQCEINIAKVDENMEKYEILSNEYKEFIKEYGE